MQENNLCVSFLKTVHGAFKNESATMQRLKFPMLQLCVISNRESPLVNYQGI